MVAQTSPEETKRLLSDITAHAEATKAAESVFQKDLRYELLNAKEKHSGAAYRLIVGIDAHQNADHRTADALSVVADEHGARFVDELLPRYVIAVRANPHLRASLRDQWVASLGAYIERATSEYERLKWTDKGELLTVMMQLVQIRLEQRIDHAIRGIVIEPKHEPKWQERHSAAYAVGLVVLGAVLGGVADAVVKALTGS